MNAPGNWKFTHIEFSQSDEQYFCILQGDQHSYLIHNKTNRDNTYVSQELRHTIVKSVSVNPNDH